MVDEKIATNPDHFEGDCRLLRRLKLSKAAMDVLLISISEAIYVSIAVAGTGYHMLPEGFSPWKHDGSV